MAWWIAAWNPSQLNVRFTLGIILFSLKSVISHPHTQLTEHRYWVTNINFLCTKLGAGWSQQSHFCQKLLSSFFEFILMVNFFSENTTFTKWILEIENLLNLAVKKVFDCFNHIFTSCWCHRKCYFGTMRYPWVSCQKNIMCWDHTKGSIYTG